ncbi:pyridoxamine 5'-phosphate oxidase family protein [Roseobacter sp. CCS2]|uniref:pyridoxamine 5'-phosphate oxidase family protein n=1 Tax=Roseobacter sp. CCS2 TaxID=391593 RepID=UPI0000F3F79B|nr:pyridoxamine 5'-phosphate oxidase family protein [Roseobacter sp. CCS2]EBA10589.1 pyridoxamine 5'-phosphate oxidase-related, FMN-binding protein [Roseobacter sp. CCS2]
MTIDNKRFWEILKDTPICMVTTVDGNVLRSRPMAPYIDTNKKTIQFMTDGDSAKLFEIAENKEIGLSFADQKNMVFASVSATATVSRDKALINELWDAYAEVFFGNGPEGADVAIIKAEPTQAEFWDNSKGTLAIAAEMTRAFFSDDGPNLGDNEKLQTS